MSDLPWDGKTRGGLLGYKIFHFILSTFGLSIAYFILYFVAFYFLLFAPNSTSASYYYFRHIQQYTPLKSILSVYQSYYRFGQTLLDKVAILKPGKSKLDYSSNGTEYLKDLVDENEGAILISAHLGNWEIASHFLSELNVPINIVLYDGEHQKIKKMLKAIMVKKLFNVIAIKDDLSHIYEIKRAVENNEFICIHGDRFKEEQKIKTKKILFLGKMADFPIGPFDLVNRLKIPYAYVFALKSTKYHYKFYAFEPKVKWPGSEKILKEYTTILSKMVIKYPKQWFNYYRFWND